MINIGRRLCFIGEHLHFAKQSQLIFFSGTCNFDYDFIIKNEDAYYDNKFILWAMGLQRKTHVPGKYKGAVTVDSMLEPYRNISSHVIEQIYRNYYRLVPFNQKRSNLVQVTSFSTITQLTMP